MPRGTPRDYETTLAKTIRANCDKDLHNQIKLIACRKGIPMYVFLDIEMKRIIDKYKAEGLI